MISDLFTSMSSFFPVTYFISWKQVKLTGPWQQLSCRNRHQHKWLSLDWRYNNSFSLIFKSDCLSTWAHLVETISEGALLCTVWSVNDAQLETSVFCWETHLGWFPAGLRLYTIVEMQVKTYRKRNGQKCSNFFVI